MCVRARKESREEDGKKGLASAPVTMVDGTTYHPHPYLGHGGRPDRLHLLIPSWLLLAAVWCVV